ncbi:hypothetical protein [Burkholderia vietnamiensis]|uniref:hypothetical protein n=1 Tax=Burkholderia vietnamiensis TaxID=60552 RepID=UPI001CF51A01|nr:hypothetical protein [Burkholderia vietnamiensis]MCA8270361.1 hypothetical protein [Burkholderia vietnamiensis]
MERPKDTEILRSALKEAEEELCSLGDMLTNDGWDTLTIARTLDVVRIALYGGNGFGLGIGDFDSVRKVLHELREVESGGKQCRLKGDA